MYFRSRAFGIWILSIRALMIEIRNLTKAKIDSRVLRKVARELFRKEGIKNALVSVVLLPPRRAQALNKKYRKKSYVPNVLSFGYGEIVLCPAKIKQDAKKYGIVFEQELVRVFTHGLLHILGYNHTQMEKIRSTKSEARNKSK